MVLSDWGDCIYGRIQPFLPFSCTVITQKLGISWYGATRAIACAAVSNKSRAYPINLALQLYRHHLAACDLMGTITGATRGGASTGISHKSRPTVIFVYRGTSPIRNRHPPRTPLGPWAYAYGRVLGGGVSLWVRYPCTVITRKLVIAWVSNIWHQLQKSLEIKDTHRPRVLQ